jgi:hypothetical protein
VTKQRFPHLLANSRYLDVEGADRRQRLSFGDRSEEAAQEPVIIEFSQQVGAVGEVWRIHRLPIACVI